jgi:hypothetical protein
VKTGIVLESSDQKTQVFLLLIFVQKAGIVLEPSDQKNQLILTFIY